MNVYTHVQIEDLHNVVNALSDSKQYDFYPLSRHPDIISPNLPEEDDFDMGEPDFDEAPDDAA